MTLRFNKKPKYDLSSPFYRAPVQVSVKDYFAGKQSPDAVQQPNLRRDQRLSDDAGSDGNDAEDALRRLAKFPGQSIPLEETRVGTKISKKSKVIDLVDSETELEEEPEDGVDLDDFENDGVDYFQEWAKAVRELAGEVPSKNFRVYVVSMLRSIEDGKISSALAGAANTGKTKYLARAVECLSEFLSDVYYSPDDVHQLNDAIDESASVEALIE